MKLEWLVYIDTLLGKRRMFNQWGRGIGFIGLCISALGVLFQNSLTLFGVGACIVLFVFTLWSTYTVLFLVTTGMSVCLWISISVPVWLSLTLTGLFAVFAVLFLWRAVYWEDQGKRGGGVESR